MSAFRPVGWCGIGREKASQEGFIWHVLDGLSWFRKAARMAVFVQDSVSDLGMGSVAQDAEKAVFWCKILYRKVGLVIRQEVREATQSPCRILCRHRCRIRYRIVYRIACREGGKSGGSRPLILGRGRPRTTASGRASWGVQDGLSGVVAERMIPGYPSVLFVSSLSRKSARGRRISVPESGASGVVIEPPGCVTSARSFRSGFPQGKMGAASEAGADPAGFSTCLKPHRDPPADAWATSFKGSAGRPGVGFSGKEMPRGRAGWRHNLGRLAGAHAGAHLPRGCAS